MGNWEDFLLDEMIPAIEREFRVAAGAKHRAIFGKSSGGYGSLVQGLRHGESWVGVASHSGDMRFDLVYLSDFPRMLDMLAGHGGDVGRFLKHLRSAVKIGRGEMMTLMHLAMAASYDPDPSAPMGIRLPVDPDTCELIAERWQRWLEHDPVHMIEKAVCQESLRKLRGLFVDCGSKDQYHLHYGARTFARKLEELGIEHRYEEFEDDHSAIDYRMDLSLPFLYEATT
jgi:S-formylglutathione hydrolase FrmB